MEWRGRIIHILYGRLCFSWSMDVRGFSTCDNEQNNFDNLPVWMQAAKKRKARV